MTATAGPPSPLFGLQRSQGLGGSGPSSRDAGEGPGSPRARFGLFRMRQRPSLHRRAWPLKRHRAFHVRAVAAAVAWSLAAAPAVAMDGSWTLTAEAPVLATYARPHPVRLKALGTAPMPGAAVRSVSWTWDYPAMPGAILLRICIADRCLDTAERSAFGDTRLARAPLTGPVAASFVPLGPTGQPLPPVVGSPLTVTVDWAAP